MSRDLKILHIKDEKEVWEHSPFQLQDYAISVRLVIVLNFPVVYFSLFFKVLAEKSIGFYHFLSKDFFVWKHLL